MAKTVYLGMIADIMHPGLINIINEGAKYGDVIIGLFTDKAIAQHKRLPYLTYEQRKNVVENIRNVSRVVPQDDWSYAPNLRRLKPDYIIHGDDWLTGPDRELREEAFGVMQELGGQVSDGALELECVIQCLIHLCKDRNILEYSGKQSPAAGFRFFH